jgi:hypothetical protein
MDHSHRVDSQVRFRTDGIKSSKHYDIQNSVTLHTNFYKTQCKCNSGCILPIFRTSPNNFVHLRQFCGMQRQFVSHPGCCNQHSNRYGLRQTQGCHDVETTGRCIRQDNSFAGSYNFTRFRNRSSVICTASACTKAFEFGDFFLERWNKYKI